MQDAAFRFNEELFVRVALAGFQHPQHHRLKVDQLLDMPADGFPDLDVQDLGAGRIDEGHRPLSVDHQQSIRHRVQNRRMQVRRILQFLLGPADLDRVADRRRSRNHHAQRVRMNVFPAAGNAEHAHELAVIVGQRRGRAGPAFIGLAVVLLAGHLNRPVTQQRQTQGGCPHQFLRPLYAAGVVAGPGRLDVVHPADHFDDIPFRIQQHHHEPRAGHQFIKALHQGPRGVDQFHAVLKELLQFFASHHHRRIPFGLFEADFLAPSP